MKLYTEEQVREAMFLYKAPIRPLVQQVLDQLTPIELLSDEEIEKAANTQSHYEGAMWLKYKILNQNK